MSGGDRHGLDCQQHRGIYDDSPLIHVVAGVEGDPSVAGGAWRPRARCDDGLMHLWGAAGIEDPPLHVHEFPDRLPVVTSETGLFSYLPDLNEPRCFAQTSLIPAYAGFELTNAA